MKTEKSPAGPTPDQGNQPQPKQAKDQKVVRITLPPRRNAQLVEVDLLREMQKLEHDTDAEVRRTTFNTNLSLEERDRIIASLWYMFTDKVRKVYEKAGHLKSLADVCVSRNRATVAEIRALEIRIAELRGFVQRNNAILADIRLGCDHRHQTDGICLTCRKNLKGYPVPKCQEHIYDDNWLCACGHKLQVCGGAPLMCTVPGETPADDSTPNP